MEILLRHIKKLFIVTMLLVSTYSYSADISSTSSNIKIEFVSTNGESTSKESTVDIGNEKDNIYQLYKDLIGTQSGKATLTITKVIPGEDQLLEFIEEHSVVNGLKDGRAKVYFHDFLRKEIDYLEGVKHGAEIEYWSPGHPQHKAKWKNGVLQGYRRYYYIHGQIACELPYQKGKLDGAATFWGSDGAILATGAYSDGRPENGSFVSNVNIFIRRAMSGPDLYFPADFLEVDKYENGNKYTSFKLSNDRTDSEINAFGLALKKFQPLLQ